MERKQDFSKRIILSKAKDKVEPYVLSWSIPDHSKSTYMPLDRRHEIAVARNMKDSLGWEENIVPNQFSYLISYSVVLCSWRDRVITNISLLLELHRNANRELSFTEASTFQFESLLSLYRPPDSRRIFRICIFKNSYPRMVLFHALNVDMLNL